MSEKQQRLVYTIIEFLNQSIENGTVKADDKEGLEVASAFQHRFHMYHRLSNRIDFTSSMHRRSI